MIFIFVCISPFYSGSKILLQRKGLSSAEIRENKFTYFGGFYFDADNPLYFLDFANLFSKEEGEQFNTILLELGEEFGIDVIIVAVPDIGKRSPSDFAQVYYRTNGYGKNEDNDGVILLFAKKQFTWALSSYGRGAQFLGNQELAYIQDSMYPLLMKDKYQKAFKTYIKHVKSIAKDAEAGKSFNKKNLPYKRPLSKIWIFISIFFGAAFSKTMVSKVLIKKEKKKEAYSANIYIKKDSFVLTRNETIKLDEQTTKR